MKSHAWNWFRGGTQDYLPKQRPKAPDLIQAPDEQWKTYPKAAGFLVLLINQLNSLKRIKHSYTLPLPYTFWHLNDDDVDDDADDDVFDDHDVVVVVVVDDDDDDDVGFAKGVVH